MLAVLEPDNGGDSGSSPKSLASPEATDSILFDRLVR